MDCIKCDCDPHEYEPLRLFENLNRIKLFAISLNLCKASDLKILFSCVNINYLMTLAK